MRKHKRLAVFALLAVLGAQQASAADVQSPARGKWTKKWIASWVALAAVNAFDIHSSRGHREANPLFRDSSGRFAPRKAFLIKSAIAGGFFASQLWVIRSHPEKDYSKPFTLANTVAAGGLGAVAVHNYSLRLPPPRTAPVPATGVTAQ